MSIRPIHSPDDVRGIEAHPFEAYLRYTSVMHALETQEAKHPDGIALKYIQRADLDEPAQQWTYPQLLAQVRRTARLFQSLSGDQAPRVAFLLPAIPQAHFTLWGAEAVGIACPINYLLSEEHIADLLQAASVNVLVALGPRPELDIWSRVAGIRRRCPQLTHVLAVGAMAPTEGALDFDQAVAAQSDAPLPARAAMDDVAALFHTGGTTGSPKLAQHQHRNQLCAAAGAACMYGASERDVIVNGFPLFHVAGSFVYGLSMFLVGGTVVLPTLLGMRSTDFVQRYWRFAEREKATLLAAVPTVMSSLLTVPADGVDISRVRALLTGGSPLPPDLAQAFERRFGAIRPMGPGKLERERPWLNPANPAEVTLAPGDLAAGMCVRVDRVLTVVPCADAHDATVVSIVMAGAPCPAGTSVYTVDRSRVACLRPSA